jgi:hypothetical protein
MAMDLTTYTGLQAAIADYLNRTDLTNQIPGFIQLAEAQIARDLRRTTVRATISLASANVTMPATLKELRSIRLVTASPTQDTPIRIVTPDMLAERRAGRTATGRPRYACIVGSDLLLVPAPDQAYSAEITYFQKLIPLSGGNPSNAVLVEGPDAYLFGALKEAAPFMQHDERIAVWEAKFDDALASMQRARANEEQGASLRPARLPRVF